MALTLKESGVTANETFNEMLEDLQGNILKHHGRTHALHIFVRFRADKADALKEWIRSFTENKIVSSKKQLLDARTRKEDPSFDGGVFCSLSLSCTGYQKLGIDNSVIPGEARFKAGMRNSQGTLQDNPSDWEWAYRDDIDALIIVSDSDYTRAAAEKNSIVSTLSLLTEMVHIQEGEVLRNEHGLGIEHFGYVDGVSQPVFLQDEIAAASGNTDWKDGAPLELVLVKDKGGKFEDSYGSYLVYRKLDQNVRAFKTEETRISRSFNFGEGIHDSNGIPNDELAGAMLVGRFEDGTEVVTNSQPRGITNEASLSNDFTYKTDPTASKCPFHAHIRITNPRQDVGDFAPTVRLIRRGIPYNDIGRNVLDLEQEQPESGVGLLFMCYQADISRQFEFIQSVWANNGSIGAPPDENLVGQDGIIGQGPNTTDRKLPAQWGTHTGELTAKSFKGFVTTRGGEYFFTPSISFLKSLAAPAAAERAQHSEILAKKLRMTVPESAR